LIVALTSPAAGKAGHERFELRAARDKLVHKVCFVTAASLFDGHDASIIMRASCRPPAAK
jgi:hypothetical protein